MPRHIPTYQRNSLASILLTIIIFLCRFLCVCDAAHMMMGKGEKTNKTQTRGRGAEGLGGITFTSTFHADQALDATTRVIG
jgi:hypothetical protein